MHNKRDAFLNDVNQLHMSDGKQTADDDIFKNTIRMEMTKEGDENDGMDV